MNLYHRMHRDPTPLPSTALDRPDLYYITTRILCYSESFPSRHSMHWQDSDFAINSVVPFVQMWSAIGIISTLLH